LSPPSSKNDSTRCSNDDEESRIHKCDYNVKGYGLKRKMQASLEEEDLLLIGLKRKKSILLYPEGAHLHSLKLLKTDPVKENAEVSS
jgi:hypothetical protein